MQVDDPNVAAPMIEALNARARVEAVIRLSDGMQVDVEGVARSAWVMSESELIDMTGDPTRRSMLTIAVEGEDDAEVDYLQRDDHGYVMVPLSVLPNVVDVPGGERWPAGGWTLSYDLDDNRVSLTIRARRGSTMSSP